MRFASINLNKRLGKPGRPPVLEEWLQAHAVDVLVAQEPWGGVGVDVPTITGFADLGGTSFVHAWIDERSEAKADLEILDDRWWLRLDVDDIALHVVYLSAYTKPERARQLTALHGALTGTPASNVLVVGDFNMGPSDADGRLGDAASVWNNETDRAPFRRLLADVGLVDLGAASAPHAFTLERAASGGRHSAFRCDLALASIPLAPLLTLTYDHSVRERTHGFTDHSALIVDLAAAR